MFLKKLQLNNFRNFQKLDFDFDNQITVLVGDNAQGKSNFLESIYFLATTKSYKAEREEELIKSSQSALHVEGEVESLESKELQELSISMQLTQNLLKKRIKVNGVPRRVSDYSGNLAVVLFAPEDINLVTGSPSLRRAHIDQTLSQVDKGYKRALSDYENIITRKNRVLKAIRELNASIDQLFFWTDQQIILGALISQKRQAFFDFINAQPRNLGDYGFKYLPNELTQERLKEYQSREIDSASSLIGPHRDDFLFMFNNLDLSRFGSRGEQRTGVLDLKLQEVSFFEQSLNKRPVLLLDDIFSELDFSHRKHVISISKLQQTIIATVDWDDYLAKELADSKVTKVKAGKFV